MHHWTSKLFPDFELGSHPLKEEGMNLQAIRLIFFFERSFCSQSSVILSRLQNKCMSQSLSLVIPDYYINFCLQGTILQSLPIPLYAYLS